MDAKAPLRCPDPCQRTAEQRWLARMRRRVGLGALVLVLVVALVPTFRDTLFDRLPLTTRHQAIAAYSTLLPEIDGTADMVPIAHNGSNPYGINVFLEQEVEEEKVRRSLAMIRDAGFGWIKQQMVWGEIEVPTKGSFIDGATGGNSWRKYDRIVDLAAEYGLQVIFRIDTSPEWARPGSTKLETPPDDLNDYGDFVARVAERYRGRVRHYQIWNEPNLPFEWGGQPPDAVAYTRMLEIAYRRIHAADPDALVLSAAMAPTTDFSEYGINELIFLQRMYDAGARGSFDILGANAYGLRSGPDDRRTALDRDVNFSRPMLVRELMVRNGDAALPIWAAEVGWNSLPEGFPEPSLWGSVDRETQAAYTARAYLRAQQEWPWMGVMNLWLFRLVSPDAPKLQLYYFGAVHEDFQPFPVFEAMRQIAHRPRVMERGYRQEDDWTIDYSGTWQTGRSSGAVLGAFRETSELGAGLAVRFRGTDLDLVVARTPGGGRIAVSIDGAPAAANGPITGSEVSLAAPTDEWQVRLPAARALPDGVHVLRVRALDAGPVRIDGFVVDRRRGSPGFTPTALLIVLGAAGIVVVATVASCRGRVDRT